MLLRREWSTHLVGIWSSVRHRESSASVVLVVWMELVGEGNVVSPNRRFLPRGVRRIPSLNHESANISVKDRPIVLARSGESQKVECCPWASITKDFALEIPRCCVDGDRHGGLIFGTWVWLLSPLIRVELRLRI